MSMRWKAEVPQIMHLKQFAYVDIIFSRVIR